MTLRNRVSVAAAIGVLVVVAAVSSVLYLSYAASLHSRVDAELVDAAQQASTIAQRVKQSGSDKGPAPDLSKPVTVGSIEVQLFPGLVDAGQPTRFGPLEGRDVAVAEHAQPAYFTDAYDRGQRYRLFTAAMPDTSTGALVRTSRAANADYGALRNAALLLAGLTLAAAAVTYGVARLTAGRILRPIAKLTAAAEHVTATHDLTARLGTTSTDEVGRLGASFDTMLAALHESVSAQRRLVADASHELRTPLTSLTTNLDLLEDGAGLADPQAPTLVRAAREQAGELDQLISDLLDLARYHESAPHREAVRLDLLTGEAVRRRPAQAIDTELHPCLVHVDPAAVDHAISNLIDNAIKWSLADAAAVRVVVEDGRVSVTDHGPGITDDDLPHIYERFYRAPAARGMPGAGLGLAIVGSVAHANNGTIDVQTGPDGSNSHSPFPHSRTPLQPRPSSRTKRRRDDLATTVEPLPSGAGPGCPEGIRQPAPAEPAPDNSLVLVTVGPRLPGQQPGFVVRLSRRGHARIDIIFRTDAPGGVRARSIAAADAAAWTPPAAAAQPRGPWRGSPRRTQSSVSFRRSRSRASSRPDPQEAGR
jgi:two-component system, OmpR family, sensor histidine kinase MprB